MSARAEHHPQPSVLEQTEATPRQIFVNHMKDASDLRRKALSYYITVKGRFPWLRNRLIVHAQLMKDRDLRREYVRIHRAARGLYNECASDSSNITEQEGIVAQKLLGIQRELERKNPHITSSEKPITPEERDRQIVAKHLKTFR